MAHLLQVPTEPRKTLYAIAYETQGKADIVHFHARDERDAKNQVLRGFRSKVFQGTVRIVGIAPAIL